MNLSMLYEHLWIGASSYEEPKNVATIAATNNGVTVSELSLVVDDAQLVEAFSVVTMAFAVVACVAKECVVARASIVDIDHMGLAFIANC